MKFCFQSLALLCVLCASVVNCFSLDREAFTFTQYDLTLTVEPDQHRLGVRGRVTLRNNSQAPQKIAVLQISSSLAWRSIKSGDKLLQFVNQPFTSDIDHTGELSEAVITLPQPIAPKGTIDLDIAYEGVIVPDTTRLTRIGTPEDVAKSTDWDQIDAKFTGVRGAGYVAWYPIATEAANLSEGDSLSETLDRWKRRHEESNMNFTVESTQNRAILSGAAPSMFTMVVEPGIAKVAVFNVIGVGQNTPTFVIGDYKKTNAGPSEIEFLDSREASARSYADILANIDPVPDGRGSGHLLVADLPEPYIAPFLTDAMVLMPLKPAATAEDRLSLVYAVAKRRVRSPRAWIVEGLAHLAQVVDIENQHGRKAALDYLNAHHAPLVDAEKASSPADSSDGNKSGDDSLINVSNGVFLQTKAMWVWWMLRDMIGDASVNMIFQHYKVSDDKEASYMPKLLETAARRDLEWFFDDWVYRDRGLPDFKVESAFSRKTMTNSFMVTVSVENLGAAGAEVPVIVKFAGGEVTKRLEVRAKSKGAIRVEVPAAPVEIVVNDGSVPESDLNNNTFKVEAESK
jgi:hypothetical protein